ncbi:MAG: GlcNAc-PI de-N-acetylase [Phototrophicales bacterium]|nr:MAG: GlcNAc-PI de-N-acetylase [Phototrophicales bacterium]
MSEKRMLVALAHPDDESFGSGALLAKYTAEGTDVYYICATLGDRGTIAPEYLERYGSVAATRDAELNCAAEVLGLKHVYKFGYRDSGMMGSPDNDDPSCLWQADEDEVTERIVAVIREVKPQVVLTFDPFGAYGHPDHIYMHRVTTRAFHAAGDATQFPDAGPAYQPQKLYYTNISRAFIRVGIWNARLRFQNPRQLGVNKDIDLVQILDKVPPAHVRINVGPYMHIGEQASRCHASQGGGLRGFLPPRLRRILFRYQTLTRAFPPPPTDKIIEHDLFEGIT